MIPNGIMDAFINGYLQEEMISAKKPRSNTIYFLSSISQARSTKYIKKYKAYAVVIQFCPASSEWLVFARHSSAEDLHYLRSRLINSKLITSKEAAIKYAVSLINKKTRKEKNPYSICHTYTVDQSVFTNCEHLLNLSPCAVPHAEVEEFDSEIFARFSNLEL